MAALSTQVIAPAPTPLPLAVRTIGQPSAFKTPGMSCGMRSTMAAAVAAVAARALSGKGRKVAAAPSAVRGFDPTKEVGAIDPLGYWDPLHLMREGFKNPDGEFKSEETFRWYRAAELKHGRVSMMALVGLGAASVTKFYGFEDVPDGWAALSTGPGGAGMGLIVLAAGIFELDIWKQDPSKAPGDFGDPVTATFGADQPGPGDDYWSYSDDMRNRELSHCRIAMSAVISAFLLDYGGVSIEGQYQPALWPFWVKLGLGVSFVAWVAYTNDNYYIADDSAILGEGRPENRQQRLLTK